MTNKFTVELPALYGDHHVIEVRRMLLGMPGVTDVYASSAFRVAEITFDPQKISEQDITSCLDDAGYLTDLDIPVEVSTADENGKRSFMRHTAFYEQTRSSMTFGQEVVPSTRPLWNCPGMGVIRKMEE